MADTKLALMTAASALDGTELHYVEQGGVDRKATGLQIKTYASGLTVDSTPISGGTTLRLLYDNAGALGETAGITFTGAGVLTMTANPVAPDITTGNGSGAMFGASIVLGQSSGSSYLPFITGIGAAGGVNALFEFSVQNVFVTQADTRIGWSSSGSATASSLRGGLDTILTRGGVASLQLGAADAAAPVAQTLTVQSVAAGGAGNVAGADFTIAGSKGTGTGAGGSIIFKTAPAGGASTSQNALVTALTINSKGSVNIQAGTIVAPALTFGGDASGFYRNASEQITFVANGTDPTISMFASAFRLRADYPICWTANNSTDAADTFIVRSAAATLQLGALDAAAAVAQTLEVQSVAAGGAGNIAGANFTIRGSAGTGTGIGGSIIFQTAPAGGSGTSQNAPVTALTIDSTRLATFAGGLNVQDGTNARIFSVYNTYSGAGANYERGVMDWTANSNVLTIGTQNAGTGVARNLMLIVGGSNRLDYGQSNASRWTFAGGVNLVAGTASNAPLVFASGTSLTTAAAGALEYDGKVHYATSVASARQIINAEQVQNLTATRTLTNNTSAQAIFNATANGALTLAAATTYEFEMLVAATGFSASAHTLNFGFGGTATFTSIGYFYDAQAGSTPATPAASFTGFIAVATASAVVASGTTTGLVLRVRGTIRINAGGTVIPQLTQVTASAAAVVQANSFFRCWPAGDNTTASVGNWS